MLNRIWTQPSLLKSNLCYTLLFLRTSSSQSEASIPKATSMTNYSSSSGIPSSAFLFTYLRPGSVVVSASVSASALMPVSIVTPAPAPIPAHAPCPLCMHLPLCPPPYVLLLHQCLLPLHPLPLHLQLLCPLLFLWHLVQALSRSWVKLWATPCPLSLDMSPVSTWLLCRTFLLPRRHMGMSQERLLFTR
jgi:hypothetical protein